MLFAADGLLHTAAAETKKMEKANYIFIERMSMKRLIKSYLCEGEYSLCVLYGDCPCLRHCKYGQEYVGRMKNE